MGHVFMDLLGSDNFLVDALIELVLLLTALGLATGVVVGTRWGMTHHAQATTTLLALFSLAFAYGAAALIGMIRGKEVSPGKVAVSIVFVIVPALAWMSVVAPNFIDFVLDI